MALNDLSFSIAEGEVVGLIGPNGSGKSTVFNVITGMFPPTSGQIIFREEDITDLPAYEVAARGIARTFQMVKPFLHLTALQNVLVGRMYGHEPIANREQAERESIEIMDLIGLTDKQHLKADSLTVIERKRLELARALATRPKLLLLDEFMAGLTEAEIQSAMKLIGELKTSGITIVVVEHIVKAVMNLCDSVIVLNAGQKIAVGSPKEVSNDPEVITAYLGEKYAAN